MKTEVEIITDWIEKNIDKIYFPDFDTQTGKETGTMYFNREFVLSHLSGVMPDVKKRLQSRQAAVSGSVCEHDFEYQKLGTIGSKVLKCTKCGKIAN